jgi:hypothetical protein
MHLPDERWIALEALLSPAKGSLSIDDDMRSWHTLAARILDAHSAVIRLTDEDARSISQRCTPTGNVGARQTESVCRLTVPIVIDGESIGTLSVSDPKCKAAFDHEDNKLLSMLASLIGKMVQVAQLRALLSSRFAQIAVARGTRYAVSRASEPQHGNHAQVARILGKSFCREMAQAGFSIQQIINAASEIIGEVSRTVEKHKRRRDRMADTETLRKRSAKAA